MKLAIDTIETRTSTTKGDYAYGKGSIQKNDGTTKPVTIMSFGDQYASVRDSMVAGATVEVNAVFDGGVLKVLSPYTPKAQADDAQAA